MASTREAILNWERLSVRDLGKPLVCPGIGQSLLGFVLGTSSLALQHMCTYAACMLFAVALTAVITDSLKRAVGRPLVYPGIGQALLGF